MNKTEFINNAAKQIREFLPSDIAQDIEIEPIQIVKMNDQKLNGLRFHRSDDSPQPTIYLDQAYENLCNGESAEHIFRKVADSYIEANAVNAVPQTPDFNYENVKDKLTFRLIEASRNKEFLKNVPSMSVGNGLAMVCDIRLSNDGAGGFFSTVVNNDLMKSMGWNKAEVFKQAMADSWRNDPPVLQSMENRLFGLNEAENLLYGGEPVGEMAPMYILSNETSVHGAAALFYPDVQEKISEVLGENYYALPSSLHEFIIVPESAEPTEKELVKMVKQANRSVVEPAEVLSDNVFKYDMASKTLEIAAESRIMDKKLAERMC